MKYMVILLFCCFSVASPAQKNAIDSLERRSLIQGDDTAKVLLLRELAFLYLQSDPARSLEIAGQMKVLSRTLNFPAGTGLALDIDGNARRSRGEYTQALDCHLQALQIFDSLGDIKRYRSVLVNTASDYSYLKNFERALSYYEQALRLTDSSEVSRYVTILNNMGYVYSILQQHEKAISVYTKALPLAEADSSYQMQSALYPSLAIAFGEMGKLDQAVYYMLLGMRCQELSGDRYHYASSASTLSEYYIALGRYQEAEQWLEKAGNIATGIGAKSIIADYYKNRALLFSKTGRHRESYEWLRKYIALNDSLINELHIAELSKSQVRFDTEKQGRELAQLHADNTLRESQLKEQKLWLMMLILALCTAAVVIAAVFRNMQLRKKLNQSLQFENTVLQKENILAQYETLRNQVNPHFLFNSLNAVSSLIRSDPEKALQFTAKFASLYRQVLDLKGDSLISLEEELSLVEDYLFLQKIRFGGHLQIETDINPSVIDTRIPPFCVQMLVENAIKHNTISAESPLHIRLKSEGRQLVVSNNIQLRAATEESTGVGIRNITGRYRLMHNELPSFLVSGQEYIVKIPLIV